MLSIRIQMTSYSEREYLLSCEERESNALLRSLEDKHPRPDSSVPRKR